MPSTIKLHRVFAAPPARVYKAFIDADAKCKWLPPNGFTAHMHEHDARVGGKYRMSFRNFTTGSSQELRPYDGANLARRHDVVVVSMNHRLNVFGFLDLSTFGGEKYKTSGNVGMLDLVAALEWIRDNIAGFGGDPGNVTIFGQSGGGRKVSTLRSTCSFSRPSFHPSRSSPSAARRRSGSSSAVATRSVRSSKRRRTP